ncbi:MAG TPA: hypothetical protein VMT23_02765 [Candidatus Binatia bacterium]|nr:hypothetical protein [Candidatus Binatia bacterium]
MDRPQQAQPKKFNWTILVVTLIVIAVIGSIGWHAHDKNHTNTSTKAALNVPTGWSLFKSAAYGFQLTYPSDWGQASATKTALQKGNSYVVSFSQNQMDNAPPKHTITIYMESEDAQTKACNSDKTQCSTSSAETKNSIDEFMKGNNHKNTIEMDDNSYAILIPAESQISSGVSIHRIVSLPSINSSAAIANYYIINSPPCTDSMVISDGPGCVPQADLGKVSQTLKSLQSI